MSALTDQDALHIASELRSRRSTARKRNLKASKPLKVHPKPINADTTSQDAEVKRTALQQTLQVLDLLPANSTYAKHRRAIVQKALDLLDAERYQQVESDHLPSPRFSHFHMCLLAGVQHKSLNWRGCLSALTSLDILSAPFHCPWLRHSQFAHKTNLSRCASSSSGICPALLSVHTSLRLCTSPCKIIAKSSSKVTQHVIQIADNQLPGLLRVGMVGCWTGLDHYSSLQVLQYMFQLLLPVLAQQALLCPYCWASLGFPILCWTGPLPCPITHK